MPELSRRMFAAGLLTAPLVAMTAPNAEAAVPSSVWVIGDSVGAGGYLSNPDNGWVGQVTRRAALRGVTISNYSVGGMALHSPTGDPNTGINRAKALFGQGLAAPDTVVVALGTNDVIQHNTSVTNASPQFLDYSFYAALDLEAYLRAQGVKRVVWCATYPMAAHDQPTAWGGYVYYFWVPDLMARIQRLNGWLWATWGGEGRVVDNFSTLLDWPDFSHGRADYFLDGFHPTQQGHDRVAASFPLPVL